jgi:hypothetical protein
MEGDEEVNPTHPVTEALRGQWHKLVICLMLREGKTETVLSNDEVMRLGEHEDKVLVAHAKGDGLHLKLMTKDQAKVYAVTQGSGS